MAPRSGRYMRCCDREAACCRAPHTVLLVWTVSYFGIMPGLRILQPAHEHPLRRNGLMIVAHLVWGSTMAGTLRELELAEQEVLASEIAPDRVPPDHLRRQQLSPGRR